MDELRFDDNQFDDLEFDLDDIDEVDELNDLQPKSNQDLLDSLDDIDIDIDEDESDESDLVSDIHSSNDGTEPDVFNGIDDIQIDDEDESDESDLVSDIHSSNDGTEPDLFNDIDDIQIDDEDDEDDDNTSEISTPDNISITTKQPEDTDSISTDLDLQIAQLQAELDQGREAENSSASSSDDTLDSNILLNDDEDFTIINRQNEFISNSGDIVIMDPKDSGDAFRLEYIDIANIGVQNKRIRNNTNVEDLIKSIRSTGLLKPVVVAPAAADGYFVLLDGFRRLLACAKVGKNNIPCIVNTKVNVPEIPILEAMYNHQKKYSIKEQIDYIDYLEKEKGIMSASMIEYLLQMNSGDYTKLKDILNDNDDDIVSKLIDGIYNIDTAFKKLEQRRKKESAEEKELKKATRVYEEDPDSGAETIAESGEMGDSNASENNDALEYLSMSASDVEDVDGKDLETILDNSETPKPHVQDYKYRERLDPDLRKSVLARDNNTCRACKDNSGQEFVDTLDVHHIKEVYLGGSDDIDNLITLCTVCHRLVHKYARGELYLRPKSEMDEKMQDRFAKITFLGDKIKQDMKAKGFSIDELKKYDNAETIGRTKPGTGQVAG